MKKRIDTLDFNDKQLAKVAFVKANATLILSLNMDGWPHIKQMPDYDKWLILINKTRVKRIYALRTNACDIIYQLRRLAEKFKSA